MDSRRWIAFLLKVLPALDKVVFSKLAPLEQRMMQMFYYSVWGKVAEDWNSDEVVDNLFTLINSPIMLAELMDVLHYKYDHIDFIDEPVELGFDCPLDLHCSYTRDQILLAMDYMLPNTV